MKYVNFYSGMAMVLIASLLGSLGSTTGELAPPLVLGALLATVLVLGWAGGASDSRHELDGGTGPKAAVFLVNISLTSWTYTKETAEAYARGWNSGVRALRGALTEAAVVKLLPTALGDNSAGSASTPATTGAQS
ncbi:hypothetical protein ACQ4WP_03420 [Janthinobacterium sp. GB4P2]|uniref:hypothetical protein n=1 Tax=Janthinobacterium sp. GB4P2 TaxID=3424189 RepID=UPI003F204F02